MNFRRLVGRLTTGFLRVKTGLLPVVVGVSLGAAAAGATGPPPLHEQIDAALLATAANLDTGLCSDTDFVRRASLDFLGYPPTSDEVRAFLADTTAGKRARLVDRLVADPQHARHLTAVLDVMLMERRAAKHVKAEEWRQWLSDSVTSHKSWDRLVCDLFAADGSNEKTRGQARWLLEREAEPNLLTRDTGRLFLGIDMACAQCHDHPRIADYWQRDYYGLLAFFGRTYLFQPDEKKPALVGERADGEVTWTSVFTKVGGHTRPHLPGAAEIVEPPAEPAGLWSVPPNEKDKSVRPVPKYSRRARLAEPLVASRAFARASANRFWAVLMGRGVIEPFDLQHSANPPAADGLLEVLTDGLMAAHFDLDAFFRELALSRAYQRPLEPPVAVPPVSLDPVALAAGKSKGDDLERTCVGTEAPVREAWESKQRAFQAVEAESKAAAKALAEAQKTVDTATAAHAKTIEPLGSKKDLLQTLAAAAAQCAQAAALVKDAPELAKAAEVLKSRLDRTTAEIAAINKDAEAKAGDLATKQTTLATARQKSEEAGGRAALANADANAALTALEEAAARTRTARETARRLARDVDRAETLVFFSQASARLEEARQQLAAGQKAAQSVGTALAKAREACQKLPQDQELATVIAQVQTRSEQSGQRVAELEKAAAAAAEESGRAAEKIAPKWSDSFALMRLTPLTPEQLCWSLLRATGQLDLQRAAATAEWDKKNPPAEADKTDPAKQTARRDAIENLTWQQLRGHEDQFIRLFGNTGGSPQTDFFATADQALYFENAGAVRGWTSPNGGNLADRLMKAPDAGALTEELYLSTLSRLPSVAETAEIAAALSARPADQKAAVINDLVWALLTSTEFRFKH